MFCRTYEPYFHVVFSLPAQIADIAHQNKAAIYGILFEASAETMTLASSSSHPGHPAPLSTISDLVNARGLPTSVRLLPEACGRDAVTVAGAGLLKAPDRRGPDLNACLVVDGLGTGHSGNEKAPTKSRGCQYAGGNMPG